MTGRHAALRDTDARALEFLRSFGFDAQRLETLSAQLRHPAPVTANQVTGQLTPVGPDALSALPAVGTTAHARLTADGEEAIRRGRVGVLMLAGGMATRFGGVVKALALAYDGQTFLDLKLRDAQRVATRLGARVPVLIMSSFATHEALDEALSRAAPSTPVELFAQEVSLRVTPDGELYRDSSGALSPYATGHGDLTFALRRSGALSRFIDGGGELLLMSNVDNLVATLDPAVIGAHLASRRALTVEVAPKYPGDQGGIPLAVDGVPQVIEGFRLPPDFDQEGVPVFNTNTMVMNAAAINRHFDLEWFLVRKQLDGVDVVQFERLVGQLTAHLPTHFVSVPREGAGCRFAPIKVPEDLAAQRELIARVLTD